MTTSREDKSLKPAEDKTSAGATNTPLAPVALDGRPDPAELRASDQEHAEPGKIRVQFVHHVGDKKPGNHATLPADEANSLIAARVAVLDPQE